MPENENLPLRQIARIALLGGLVIALLWGLVWALNPSEGGVTFTAPGRQDAPEETAEADDDASPAPADPDPTETAVPEPDPTPTGPPPEELIAAAPDPSDTTVQVLDAGGGPTRTLGVTDALEDLGYEVVNVTSSRTDVGTRRRSGSARATRPRAWRCVRAMSASRWWSRTSGCPRVSTCTCWSARTGS
jgi:hypothetical protein